MAFAIKRRIPPLNGVNFYPFLPHFFLLQLNLTYMKCISHPFPVKITIHKSSYNWFKIGNYYSHIHGHLNYYIIESPNYVQNTF